MCGHEEDGAGVPDLYEPICTCGHLLDQHSTERLLNGSQAEVCTKATCLCLDGRAAPARRPSWDVDDIYFKRQTDD